MKTLEANLVVIFWSVIFGEVLGYIGGALEIMTYNTMQIGIVAAIAGIIIVNGVKLLGLSDTKAEAK
ncbi:hypothetical protein AYR62_05835 [Secundilactobacillus paracollinoides]|uniref:DUF2929 domain-containing protein n=1 Tax=Secundilactobacillus paracollinoides TaxID=240427 RepID=A0A1B2J109_9LACO|nr:DUF2929 family protein [Secundilactobacillus paracollinoides]ANZ61972.1 hypothetical protein AYR61_11845 [Secundilactobacillus paracollinoides]ANZ63659.1 hypothetical protein AYR62_05835 [Secundilactobacillus paracollinoides]ANZ67918.1 hypothetical protein AYR63_12740 [Secundilactobacillus paracollinoides]KRL75208.1 hypothetical protein FC17_GL002858 [Secundilactobacillus paracollinoides DSM 15502 = JCM 11969]